MKKVLLFLTSATMVFSLLGTGLASCKRGQEQVPVPDVPVNLAINLNLPSYLKLQSMGTWIYEAGGARGIIIYHSYDDSFYAMDRNCPYRSYDSCATVTVEDFFARCGHYSSTNEWVPCCDSKFQLEEGGIVLEGPSQYSLKRYRVSRNGNMLYITN